MYAIGRLPHCIVNQASERSEIQALHLHCHAVQGDRAVLSSYAICSLLTPPLVTVVQNANYVLYCTTSYLHDGDHLNSVYGGDLFYNALPLIFTNLEHRYARHTSLHIQKLISLIYANDIH